MTEDDRFDPPLRDLAKAPAPQVETPPNPLEASAHKPGPTERRILSVQDFLSQMDKGIGTFHERQMMAIGELRTGLATDMRGFTAAVTGDLRLIVNRQRNLGLWQCAILAVQLILLALIGLYLLGYLLVR